MSSAVRNPTSAVSTASLASRTAQVSRRLECVDHGCPSRRQWSRRRSLGAMVVFVSVLGLGAGNVLAGRGGGPASVPATRPASGYVVQAGDTLWAISAQFHGTYSQSDYVDRLIDVNGDTALQIGQVVVLP